MVSAPTHQRLALLLIGMHEAQVGIHPVPARRERVRRLEKCCLQQLHLDHDGHQLGRAERQYHRLANQGRLPGGGWRSKQCGGDLARVLAVKPCGI